jgi:hypothetical protein
VRHIIVPSLPFKAENPNLLTTKAVNISEESPAADRLALQIVQAREQGLLIQYDKGSDGLAQATTADGNVWTDLPFLVPDMTRYWLEGHTGLSSAQRLSFSKFLAKLASSGVGIDDGLCRIALTTFREALETPRLLGTLADQQQEENTSRLEAELSIAAYLPSVNVWFSWAGLKIIQLSEKEKSWPAGEHGPGSLFRCADTELSMPVGFCASRWIFWLTRLESLAKSFRDSGEDSLSALATGVMNSMLIVADTTGGRLKKDLGAAYLSGTVQHRPVAQDLSHTQ